MMHPYDRWGFSDMGKEADDLYWCYCIARFSAYRNLWWSLANEYDLMRAKTWRTGSTTPAFFVSWTPTTTCAPCTTASPSTTTPAPG